MGTDPTSGTASGQNRTDNASSRVTTGFSRRSALALLGLSGLGLAAGQASANPSQSDGGGNQPWYEWTADVDANGNKLESLGALATEHLKNTDYHNRPNWSTETLTLEVGDDFPTLQECVFAIPFVPYESVEIHIPSGMDLSDEDVIVPQTVLGAGTVSGDRGYEHKVVISGDESDPSNCSVGSVIVVGINGGIISIDGVEFQRANPFKESDNTGFTAFYTNQARLHNCAFAGGTNGAMSYGANLELHQVDFGENVLDGNAIWVKHNGVAREQRAGPEPPTSGTVGGYAYNATSGRISVVRETDARDAEIPSVPSTLTGEQGLIDIQGSRAGWVTAEIGGPKSVLRWLGSYQMEGDVHQVENGKGFVTHSPDGTEYRIRVDDDGDVVTDEL